MTILIPVLVCLAVAAVCAIILTVSNVLFGVKESEEFLAIRDALPGANCGACGYSGCDGYAHALANGEIKETNLCVPGGAEASKSIASVLGVEAGAAVKRFAYVSCSGTCAATAKNEKVAIEGYTSCADAAAHWEGENLCTYSCLGLGDCAANCPNDAIVVSDGVAKVISSRCTGCGLCAKTCPHGTIKLLTDASVVAVACSNHDKGALTRKMCTVGCIGCSKCAKTCPNGAITMEENLPVIDYEKCKGCGACADACPVHAINKSSFICDNCL